jgi:hypothetical protein
MPKHQPPYGAPCWFEFASRNADASLAFHQALFGWRSVDQGNSGMGSYYFLSNSTGTIGALCGQAPGSGDMPSNWGVYFAVADLDASVAKAKSLGGKAMVTFDVPGHGRGAVLSDPTGAVFSLWQSTRADAGDFAMFEDHSIGWVELATRDSNAAQAFYTALLGWSFEKSASAPGPVDYREYMVAGTRYGGLMQMTKEWGDMPSHWSVYIPVSDVDATLKRVTELGGKVCVPAFDAPGVGRIARYDDPTGGGAYIIRLSR